MSPSDDIEARTDELYRLPLNEFTAARNALVKTLRGADATRVRKLEKPSVVAWAINQVYWHARPTYERVMKSGEQLRKAQIAALEGKKSDVRGATDAHRRAIGDAVQEAQRRAAASGSHPGADALMRTFEALSLAAERSAPGRLTDALQPAGFEALAGVTPAVAHRDHARLKPRAAPDDDARMKARATPDHAAGMKPRGTDGSERERARAEAAAEKRRVEEETRHKAELAKAQAALERARSAAALAREAAARADRDVRAAEERLARLQSSS